MSIGKRVADLRKKHNLTQEELAKRIGISRAALSHYEKDRREPDSEILTKLADFYNVTTDYLISGKIATNKNELPELTSKDEKDIAKQLESILESMNSDTALAFDGEPMDEETKELVREAIEGNLRLTKKLAKRKFTPKKYRKE